MRIQPYMIYDQNLDMILPVHFTATVGNSRSTSQSRFLIHPSVSCSSLLYIANHTYNGLQTALVDTDRTTRVNNQEESSLKNHRLSDQPVKFYFTKMSVASSSSSVRSLLGSRSQALASIRCARAQIQRIDGKS